MSSIGGAPHIDPAALARVRVEGIRDFHRATSEVLEFLSRRIGFLHWIVVRIEDGRRIVLQTTADCRFVKLGQALILPVELDRPEESEVGPRFYPDTKSILEPTVSPQPYGPIRAFLEIPIRYEDGTAFGSLCAIDPMPQPPELKRELSLVKVFASIIGWLVEMEQNAQELAREAERSAVLAMTDELTQLPNRRAWNEVIEREDERSSKLGASPGVLIVDLDGLKTVNDGQGHPAGDELIQKAAHTIAGACRESDFVARIGGDEFGVLMLNGSAGRAVENRIRQALEQARIECSIGCGAKRPPTGLDEAIQEADGALYEEKRTKKAARGLAVIEVEAGTSLNDSAG